MFPAGQQASKPTLAVCLLRDCSKSQCNIHSVRLGKPISYFSLDYSGLERQSQSLSLSASLLRLTHSGTSIHSHHLLLTLSATSLLSLHFLSCLFTFYIPVLSSPAANIFSLPSTVINHSERKILQWKPGRAKDIHPVHAGQDGRDYKYYLCLAVNIFIRE